MIYVVAMVAAIAGFLFGFDEGVIAGALAPLKAEFAISPLVEGMMTAAVPLGALAGALVAGRLAAPVGRRGLLLAAAGLFVAGALGAALSTGVAMLTAVRVVLGAAIGVAAMIAPLYISESAPAARRGMFVSIYQLAITLGIVGAYLVGWVAADAWRVMFAVGMVPGLALFFGMRALPDTPRWLIQTGRMRQARTTIARLRGERPDHPAVTADLVAIRDAVTADRGGGGLAGLTSPMVRPALVVAMGLFLLQQLSGINAVIYYAPQVFGLAGFDSATGQLLATIGIGVVNVAMTLVGMALIDRIGRRRLLLLGFAGTAASLAVIAVAAAVGTADLGAVALAGLVVYIASFAVAVGPLPWVMMSEVFPLAVRGPGMSLAQVTNWAANFLVVLTFPVIVGAIGLAGVFALYAAVCVAGVAFTLRLVPETKGVPLEVIEAHLRGGKPLRDLKAA